MRSEKMQISGIDENSSSPSSLVVYNIDLLNQILLCLPVKSLLVFKSVSKQWLSIISNPDFIQNHCIRNKQSKPGLLFPKLVNSKVSYDSFLLNESIIINDGVILETQDHKPLNLGIEQSCNGLFLCSDGGWSRSYCIYNPSTRHYRILPPDPISHPVYEHIMNSSLVFDPLKSINYEVFSIGACDGNVINDTCRIAIYSSATSSWRICRNTYNFPFFDILGRPGVFWNGCLNWVSTSGNKSISFNIDQEVLTSVPFSDEMSDKRLRYFGEWMGYMHLILSDKKLLHRWDIFEMETNYGGWKLRYRVNVGILANQYDRVSRIPMADDIFSVMLVVEGDGNELKALIHLPDERIISYDLKKKSFKEICNYPKRQIDSCHAYTVIESLANV